ncbi:MAG: SGNH/GDSL hydrolase family protein [Candidatus Aureabacteria bacterium]|nr:SGNH/GDSL hydrolase family protein [Candidatus Auribacterota bacterium]
MNNRTKWIFLAALTIVVGAAIALAGWRVWLKFAQSGGERLTDNKVPELKKRLDENPKSIFMFDAVTSYRLKPSFRGLRHDSDSLPHATNSWGILGDREIDPDPAVTKILFLGDSVAYGSYLPYEETFIPLMQERAGSSFQLLNAACPGWSIHQELAAYRRYFAGLPLRALVVVFCLNDLLRFEWVWRTESSFQMSAELRDLGGLFHSALTDISLQKARERFWSATTLSPLAELNNTCLNAYLPESWKRYRELNLPLFREAAGRAACFLIAVPSRAQLQSLDRGGEPETVLYPQERIREICGETGWEYLDLLPAFRTETGGYEMKSFLDGENGMLHLSPEGHRRLADYLWPRLSRLALTSQN